MNTNATEAFRIKTSYRFDDDIMWEISNRNHKVLQSNPDCFAYAFFIHSTEDNQVVRLIITRDFSIQTNFTTATTTVQDMERGIRQYITRLCNTTNKDDDYKDYLIGQLITLEKEVSTMESCTAGMVATTLTNYEGASNVLKGSLITYSNEAKIQFGVSANTINIAGVYSYETAIEMAQQTQKIFNSDYGIGITGSLGNIDVNNYDSVVGHIYFDIYDKYKDTSISGRIIQYNDAITRKKNETYNHRYMSTRIIVFDRNVIIEKVATVHLLSFKKKGVLQYVFHF